MLKSFYISGDELKKRIRLHRSKGFFPFIRAGWNVLTQVYLKNFFFYYFYKIFRKYRFENRSYGLFYHPYNKTWQNERAVEIPIVLEAVKKNKGSVLELGNVLNHYFPFEHDVVDKYEKFPGVKNEDIVTFRSKKKYDLIVSISTLEHVGFDEKKKDPKKIEKAIQIIKKNLAAEGKFIATVPWGENPYLDKLIKENKLPFKKQLYLKRVGESQWRQVERNHVFATRYGHPYPAANAIVIGEI